MPSVRLRPKSGGIGEYLGYRLDRFLALHPVIQLVAVLVWATLLALAFGVLSHFAVNDPNVEQDSGFWWAVTRMLDGGTVAADTGLWRRFFGIGVTLVGMVIVAIITGAFASSFADRMRDIRRGSFAVFERRHALLLGYGTHGDVILRELAASRLRAVIVVVTGQDREQVQERVREAVAGVKHRLRVIVRRADPTTTSGVRGASAKHARAVLVLPEIEPQDLSVAPRPSDPYDADDRCTLRSLLAARRVIGSRKIPIIVESTGDHGRELIELTGKSSEVTIVEEGDVSTHLLIHAVRQPGVLDVVRQVLALDATSVYEHSAGPFVDKTFDEAHLQIAPGILLGVLRHQKNLLVPPGSTRIEAHDRLLVFANDATPLTPAPSAGVIDRTKPPLSRCTSSGPVHVLVIGYRRGFTKLLRSLRTHFVARITALAPPEHEPEARAAIAASGFPADAVDLVLGQPTDAAVLARAIERAPTRLLLLAADAGAISPADLDADQLVTLLQVRRLLGGRHAETPAVVEIHVAETERLVSPHHATDFVLLREITGMLLAQELHALCMDHTAGAWLGDAFLRLLNDISTRVWIHPLSVYVPDVAHPTFADVLVAARLRGDVALGVRRPRARAHLLPPREERLDARDTDVVVITAPEPLADHPHGARAAHGGDVTA
ncbi:MAG: hypothetical protein U0441_25425 [Polyangiaceae bacterium]